VSTITFTGADAETTVVGKPNATAVEATFTWIVPVLRRLLWICTGSPETVVPATAAWMIVFASAAVTASMLATLPPPAATPVVMQEGYRELIWDYPERLLQFQGVQHLPQVSENLLRMTRANLLCPADL
jgi:hypothetical protein